MPDLPDLYQSISSGWQGLLGILGALAGIYALQWLAVRLARSIFARRGGKMDISNAEGQARSKRYGTVKQAWVSIIRIVAVSCAIVLTFVIWFPTQQASFVASALVIAIGGFAAQSFLRDVFSGTAILWERWFDVGDSVTVEPWALQGIVETMNLRSTTLRGLNGEEIHIHNAHMYAARVARRGVVNLAIDIFVRDEQAGRALLEEVSGLLPRGATYVVEPLEVLEAEQLGEGLVRVQARCSVPPGREWLIEQFALALLRERDAQSEPQTIVHGPIAFYMDRIAERRFGQAAAPLLTDG